MLFITDKQTLEDLNIQGKYKPDSLFSIFNQTKTNGGERLLDQLFHHPLLNEALINQRIAGFRYFQEKNLQFPFDASAFSIMEAYLYSGGRQHTAAALLQTFRRQLLKAMGLKAEYNMVCNGLLTTIQLLTQLFNFIHHLDNAGDHLPFHHELNELKELFSNRKLLRIIREGNVTRAWWKLARYDHFLRNQLHDKMRSMLQFIYQLDIFISVSNVAREKGFVYPLALPARQHQLTILDCRHPALEKATGNDISFNMEQNLLFLTGANMAGKSTFMKSIGTAVYLAHMGFPVAAGKMEFSIKQGLYSSINVPDNLSMGYSHFYAEVLRVKKVAEEVASGKDLLVIFDELFKGTNVQDAYDATLAVTESFAAYRNCNFIISTHIIEAGEALMEHSTNIRFAYMPTVMDGMIPGYTYTLTNGITADRHGMLIIENENILNIIP
ncbi:MAG: MutS-related protein [Pseudobacter sp.]|uniref:MutS-related protein n=1 Tax=Pseudobacter sp. TaxID=2045420 RepID=UPI003F7DABE6